MTREIKSHLVEDHEESIRVKVMDEPGPGGAHHYYEVGWEEDWMMIHFQKGAIQEQGLNGITQESLIAVVIDRLQCFQTGPFKCRENAIALTHLEDALLWLQKRTRDRMARNVEGTMTP